MVPIDSHSEKNYGPKDLFTLFTEVQEALNFIEKVLKRNIKE